MTTLAIRQVQHNKSTFLSWSSQEKWKRQNLLLPITQRSVAAMHATPTQSDTPHLTQQRVKSST